MSKSTKRGDAGLQGYFLDARALYEYILQKRNHSSHTRKSVLTSSAQKKSHTIPKSSSETPKSKEIIGRTQHRLKWSKSHAAFVDSYKTQIIIPRCQKNSRISFILCHNTTSFFIIISSLSNCESLLVNTSRIKSVSEQKFTMVDMKRNT